MGNPLVNELIIATNMKDKWNATDAEDENDFVPFYCNSALATALNTVFSTGFPTANREDLVNALLRYAPGPPVCGSGKTHEAPWRAPASRFGRSHRPRPTARSDWALSPMTRRQCATPDSRLAERSKAERRCHRCGLARRGRNSDELGGAEPRGRREFQRRFSRRQQDGQRYRNGVSLPSNAVRWP